MIKAFVLWLACFGSLAWAAGQESPAAAPCIDASDQIYTMSNDHIKPPLPVSTPKPDRKLSKAQFTLELVVNSEGAVCSVRVLQVIGAPDGRDAEELAAFIPGHWKFKPGTHKEKPVAFKFVTNFAGGR